MREESQLTRMTIRPLFGPKKMHPAVISKSPKMSGIRLLLSTVAIHCVCFCIKALGGTVS